ncbi:MAG: HD domain-containing phosphohydrolase [Gemmatimonadales bacterium]
MRTASVRCLIVDDDQSVRRSLRRLMELDGLTTVEAGSGEEGLEILKENPDIPLVITDIYMPEMGGMAFLQEIRVRHPDTSVIMLTGMAAVTTAVSCLQLGAMDYISKPLMADELRVRVARALEKRDLILQNRDYQRNLESRVRGLAHRTKEMFVEQIQLAVRMLEAKDRYTLGHSQRVREYAVQTAVMMGYADSDVEDFKVGGELHDIGKIGTSDTILNKPGPLTAEEFVKIKRHTTDGEEILRPIFRDRPAVLNIVRSHHERLDGSGFPDGLAGDEIPMEARIVAVVDAYDAMTTTRAYRPSRAASEAVEELRRCSGSQFEHDAVEAFLTAFPDLSAKKRAAS